MDISQPGCRTICRTVDPENPSGPRVEIFVHKELYQKIYKTTPVKYQNLCCVKQVLENPARVFRGVRDFQEGGWCYVGLPKSWWIREKIMTTFPMERFVFAVYVNPIMRVYEWRPELLAADDPLAPKDWQNRYEGLVWKNTF